MDWLLVWRQAEESQGRVLQESLAHKVRQTPHLILVTSERTELRLSRSSIWRGVPLSGPTGLALPYLWQHDLLWSLTFTLQTDFFQQWWDLHRLDDYNSISLVSRVMNSFWRRIHSFISFATHQSSESTRLRNNSFASFNSQKVFKNEKSSRWFPNQVRVTVFASHSFVSPSFFASHAFIAFQKMYIVNDWKYDLTFSCVSI